MKKATIKITSSKNHTLVTIQNPRKKLAVRHFANIDQAFDFALTRGDRQTDMYLNGFPCVPYFWIQ